ncbi:MAG: hypothetical protein HY721_07525, partial [Planctomycetes bacterium]|nr:hypothetical protein [Planctomycetota bacterium]
MKPESLLGIALEIIQVLDTPGGFPADARVGRFFRERRFLGSRDRKVLSEAAYSWLRHAPRARPRWTAWASERGLEDLAALAGRPGPAPHLADVLTLARDGLFPWRLPETLAAARGLRGGAPAEALREDWVAEGGWPADPLERIAAE